MSPCKRGDWVSNQVLSKSLYRLRTCIYFMPLTSQIWLTRLQCTVCTKPYNLFPTSSFVLVTVATAPLHDTQKNTGRCLNQVQTGPSRWRSSRRRRPVPRGIFISTGGSWTSGLDLDPAAAKNSRRTRSKIWKSAWMDHCEVEMGDGSSVGCAFVRLRLKNYTILFPLPNYKYDKLMKYIT